MLFDQEIIKQANWWAEQLNVSGKNANIEKARLSQKICMVVNERLAAAENGQDQVGIIIASPKTRDNGVTIILETGLAARGIVAEALKRARIYSAWDILPANTRMEIAWDGDEQVTVQTTNRPGVQVHIGGRGQNDPVTERPDLPARSLTIL